MSHSDPTMLDTLLTPDEIARRITASAGVHITARTVWDRAKRLGVAHKIGRCMLISVRDVPLLLKEEDKKAQLLARSSARSVELPRKGVVTLSFPG